MNTQVKRRRRAIISHPAFPAKGTLLAGLLVGTLLITMLSGCARVSASMAENPGRTTALCAGAGAALGAGAGALINQANPLSGAIIGGLAGALVGGATCFAVAKARSTAVKDYQQTQAATGYRPTLGTQVWVQQLVVEPAIVSTGQTFTWLSEYVVMASDPSADLPVVETRIVSAYDEQTNQWKEVGRHRTAITAKPGTRLDRAEMTMPNKTTARRYLMTFLVEHTAVADHKSQELFVATPQASLPQDMERIVVERQSAEVPLAHGL
jgi:hypothetical protein